MKKRLWALFFFIFVAFGGLAYRIYTLSDQHLVAAANKQSQITVTIANTRGTIYDRNGVSLTNTGKIYKAAVVMTTESLTELSGIMQREAFQKMSKTLQSGRPAVVELDRLVAAKGLSLFEVPIRYEGRILAPHLIGYMDANQTEGLYGIEAIYQDILSAYNGQATVSYTVDAQGKPLGGIFPNITNTMENSKGGIQLTIDADIQKAVEDTASKYIPKGAIVILSPENGDILAMASLPTFRPDAVAEVLQDENSPLLNRALCSYNCGSIFKIVSAASALESGLTPEQEFSCQGSVQVVDKSFRCHYRLGHGNVMMHTAFAKSCNCYFIQLMQQSGAEKLWSLSQQLQFHQPLNIDGLTTKTATIPSLDNLQSPAVLANFSFGQGELTATPLHIAQLIATVVNDGKLTQPRILKGYVDATGTFSERSENAVSTQVFSASTAATLRDMMEQVLEEGGTGYSGKPIYGTAGAKTGTAETGWIPAADEQYDVVQSWFVGFYPVEHPRYVVVVLAENADNTNADTAAAFKELVEFLYRYDT